MGNETIAIVGSYGSGKTVLLTVLTHYYKKVSKEGYRILPDNREAIDFCQENWDFLRRGEWPPPTPPKDNPAIYSWKLRSGTKEKGLITCDVAGEVWRAFIMDNVKGLPKSSWQVFVDKMKSIPSSLSPEARRNHVMTVEKLLKRASSIYFLLDLSHIIDKEQGYEEVMMLPICLQMYMTRIHRTLTPVSLVLSKTDKYNFLFDETPDWRVILERYIDFLPLYPNIIPVAAVAKTQMRDGEPIPAPDFPSEGLDKLFESFWNNKVSLSARMLEFFFPHLIARRSLH